MTRKIINLNLLLRGCPQFQQPIAFSLQHDHHMSMIKMVINEICYVILLLLNYIYDCIKFHQTFCSLFIIENYCFISLIYDLQNNCLIVKKGIATLQYFVDIHYIIFHQIGFN